MLQSDNSHMLLCNYHDDFKAEVVAAGMVEQGVKLERLVIGMLGSLKRTFSRDMDSQLCHFEPKARNPLTADEDFSPVSRVPNDKDEMILLNTHREGIYDMLPEGMFHYPTPHKSAASEREIIEMMKKRRQEELEARKFFLPLEASINLLRIQLAVSENRLDKRLQYDDLVKIFGPHWPIFQYLDARQSNIFLHLIPIIHEIRDDHAAVEQVIEMMFPTSARLLYERQRPQQPDDAGWSRLDESVLGVNLTTGNLEFDDGADELTLTLGPMDGSLYRQFMPGRKNGIILQKLCDCLLPVHIDLALRYELDENDKLARLEDASGFFNAVLGEDMVLM